MSIKRAAGALFAAATLFGFTSAASAQPGIGGLFGAMQSRSNPLGTLMRPEVQTHLRLDLKQKNALNALFDKAEQERRERRQQLRQSMPRPGNQQGLTRDQQREQMRQFAQQNAQQMRESFQQLEGELSEEVKNILRPEQLKRLYELDLQYRGPLALGDPKIQEQVKLTPEHRGDILKIIGEFQAAVQQLISENMRNAFPQAGAQPGQQNRFQRGQQGGRPNFQEMEAQVNAMRIKIDKMRRETEEKVLAVLSPEEKNRWAEAIGTSFAFRKDQPNDRFRGPSRRPL